MFQLSVIVVLVASMFVGRTSPLMQNEERESKVVSTSLNITNVTQSADTSSNSKSKTIDLPIKATVVKKDLDLKTMNESHIKSTSMNSTDTNVSTPINENNRDKEKLNNEKQKCNSKTEQADMLHCNVTPRDSEDDESLNTTEPATRDNATTANDKIKSSTESQVRPEVRPHKEEENGTDSIDVNNKQLTNQVPYDIVLADNRTVDTNSSDVSNTDLKYGETNETWPLAVIKKAATNVSSENIAGVAKSVNRNNNSKDMPSGIIALVTAISFAVAIALVYIGMIVWRRYIEYRYGHRELLVNELEFDTNDLRHFEL